MINALGEKTEIVCIGSSHVFRGCDPDLFSRPTGNLALGGLNYVVAKPLLENALDRLPNLKLAIVELDPVMLHSDTVQLRRASLDYREFLEAGLTKGQLDLELTEYAGFAIQELLPHRRYPSLAPSDLRSAWHPNFTNGYMAVNDGIHFRDEKDGKCRAVVHAKNRFDSALTTNALLKIIEQLRQKNIPVAFVAYPKMDGYWENISEPQSRSFENAKGLIEDFAIPIWDLRSADFAETNFRDGDHLNAQGAEKFSLLLSRHAEQLLGQKTNEYR